MCVLELENVVYRYPTAQPKRAFDALRVSELSVKAGEILTVVGPNGSGKSTLLGLMACLLRPVGGRILVDGADPWAEGKQLDARRTRPMLLQNTVLFSTSVRKNVAFGLRARGMPRREAGRRALEALDLVGIKHLARRRHNELSGGERRRVALARILALRSPAILLDEPTASLDRRSERNIEELIRTVNRERGTTVMMASHNMRQAVGLSTRIVTLLDGRLIGETLDNLFSGVMHARANGVEFRDRRGWSVLLRPEEMLEDSWEGIGPSEGPVRIGIPASGISVEPEAAPERGLTGEIDSARRDEQLCRLRVRLRNGPKFHVELPVKDYKNWKLNLGSRITLGLKTGAVRVLPAEQDFTTQG